MNMRGPLLIRVIIYNAWTYPSLHLVLGILCCLSLEPVICHEESRVKVTCGTVGGPVQ